MITYLSFAGLSALITIWISSGRAPKWVVRHVVLLALSAIAWFLCAIYLFTLVQDPPGYLYAYDTRGPYDPKFSWIHASFLLELLGGVFVGILIGLWIERYVYSGGTGHQRGDWVMIALVVIITLTVHPSKTFIHFLDRITGFELTSGKIELAEPRGGGYDGQPVVSFAGFEYASGWGNKRYAKVDSGIFDLVRGLLDEERSAEFLKPGKNDRSFFGDFRDQTYLARKSDQSEIRFLAKYMSPLAKCARLNKYSPRGAWVRRQVAELRPFLFEALDSDQIFESEDFLRTLTDKYSNLLVSALKRAAIVGGTGGYLQGLHTGALVNCRSIVFTLRTPTEIGVPRIGELASLNAAFSEFAAERMAPDAYREMVRTFLETEIATSEGRTTNHRQLISDGLRKLFRDTTRPWAAIFVSNLSAFAGNPEFGIDPLEYWWIKHASRATPYQRIAVNEQYLTLLLSSDNPNPATLIRTLRTMIVDYETALFRDDEDRGKVFDFRRYCAFNPIASRHLSQYLNLLNTYANEVAKRGRFFLDYTRNQEGLLGHLEVAQAYLVTLDRVDLDCLNTTGDASAVLAARTAFIDTEIALALAQIEYADLSSREKREIWHERFTGLRFKMQPYYSRFRTLVLAETVTKSDELGSASHTPSEHFETLMVIETRMHELARLIRHIERW